MANPGFYSCYSSAPIWDCQYFVVASHGARNSGTRFCDRGRKEQLFEGLFLKPWESLDNRIYNAGLPHSNAGALRRACLQANYSPCQRATRAAVCLQTIPSRDPIFRVKTRREQNSLGYRSKPVWVNSRMPSLDHRVERGLWLVKVRASRPDDSIQTLCERGDVDRALDVLLHMDQQGIVPSVNSYKCLLKACAKRKSLLQAKRVHAHLAQHGLNSMRPLGEFLVSTLVKCGGLKEGLEVFDILPHRTALSWTAIISGYATVGLSEQALKMYSAMRQQGLEPNKSILVSLLKACGSIPDLEEGKRIHSDALAYRLGSDLFVGTCLVDMYAKCGSIADAQDVFDGLTYRDVVSWTAILAAYSQQGQAEKALQVYGEMLEEGVNPDCRTFVSALQACAMLAEKEECASVNGQFTKLSSLKTGKELHAEAQRSSHQSDLFVSNTLVNMYGKCGSVVDAQNVFDGMFNHDLVSWNVMLAAYVEQGQAEKALQVYEQMLLEDGTGDVRTLVTTLQACGMLGDKEDLVDGQLSKVMSLEKGKAVHAVARRMGYQCDVFVCSSLISMYGKCGSIADAQNVFDGLSQRDVVLWNVMLAAYVEQAQAEKVLQLYEQMQEDSVSPSYRTFVSALQACGMCAEKEADCMVDGRWPKIKSLAKGKAIHADAWKLGYHSDSFIVSTLISMYGKCGSILDAHDVFCALCKHDVVSWTAMLAAYVEQGQGEKAFYLYKQMREGGVSPDEITLVCILQACSHMGNLHVCRQVHRSEIPPKIGSDSLLATTLIHAYGKCGSMMDAQMVFDALPQPSVVCWTALIAGYARQGNCEAALQRYEDMRLAGIQPNGVTFLSILSACCHSGLVEKGVEYFESMSKEHCISPEIEHYVSMVDLLGRAGCFKRVEDLLSTMPMEPDLSMCLCLLGACRKHGKIVLAKRAFDRAVLLHPEDSAAYVLMSNIYSDANLWNHAKEVNESKQRAGAWKKPGQSWIEHEHDVHMFMVEDCNHPMQNQLYSFIGKIRGMATS